MHVATSRHTLITLVFMLLPAAAFGAAVEVESGVTGAPGGSVAVAVRLRSMGRAVVATQNELGFTAAAPVAALPDGNPDCQVNESIGKPDSGFRFQPLGCGSAIRCITVRATILSLSNLDAIADGSVLYTCRVAIPPTTGPGTYPLTASDVSMADRNGVPFPGSQGIDGSVVVSGEPVAAPLLYVTSSEGVRVLDVATNQVLATVPLPKPPTFLSLSPDGATLLATAESDAIYVIDTVSRTLRTTILDQPKYTGTSIAPDGTVAYAVRFLLDPVSSVSLVDLATDEIVGTSPLDPDIYARIVVRPDGRKAYVPRLFHPSVSGFGFPFDITVIDLENGEIETTIPIPCGHVMFDLAFSPDGTRLYVPVLGSAICEELAGVAGGQAACIGDCDDSGTVSIDELIRGVNIALGLTALDTCVDFAGGDGSVDIADLVAAVNAALAGCSEPAPGDFAAVIDTASQEVIQVIDLGSASAPGLRADIGTPAGIEVQRLEGLGIVVSPDGRFAYITGCRDGVCVLDLIDNRVVDTIALPRVVELPSGEMGDALLYNIEIAPDGRLAYVTSLVSTAPPDSVDLPELGRIAVLDLDRREVLTTLISPGANDVVAGPPPLTCPIDFSDNNTQPGTPDCNYIGPYNATCDGQLRAYWRSNTETLTIVFQDFAAVQCSGPVTSATTADVTSCSIDGDSFDAEGTVTLDRVGTIFTIDAPDAAFFVDDCGVELYEGSLVEVVFPTAASSHLPENHR